jgi:hypothetical protein
VNILGGHWLNFSAGETTYYIANRDGLVINRITMGSDNYTYKLRAYTNAGAGIDFYLLTSNYSAIAVKSCLLGSNATQLINNTTSY